MWPNLVAAFKVVLPGNGLGKPDVFNQGGFINHVPPLVIDSLENQQGDFLCKKSILKQMEAKDTLSCPFLTQK